MHFNPCIVSVVSVVALLAKFVGGYSLMFVCSVNKSFVAAGSCWHRFSGVCSKLVNELSRVSRL